MLKSKSDKIAMALGLTVNSAKVLVNELILEGYLLKAKDNHGRRVLNLSGKPYLTISCVDLSNIDKKIIAKEAANYQRDAKMEETWQLVLENLNPTTQEKLQIMKNVLMIIWSVR